MMNIIRKDFFNTDIACLLIDDNVRTQAPALSFLKNFKKSLYLNTQVTNGYEYLSPSVTLVNFNQASAFYFWQITSVLA